MSDFLHIDGKKYLTVVQAAVLHGLLEEEVLQLAADGSVHSRSLGQKTYVDQSSLASFLAPPPPAPLPEKPDIDILPRPLPVKSPLSQALPASAVFPAREPSREAKLSVARRAPFAPVRTEGVPRPVLAGIIGALLIGLTSASYMIFSPQGYGVSGSVAAASAATDQSLLEEVRDLLRGFLGIEPDMMSAPRLDWPEMEDRGSASTTSPAPARVDDATVSLSYVPPAPPPAAQKTVIERIIERVNDGSGVSRAVLDAELQSLYDSLSTQISRTDPYVPATQVWDGVARALQIDSLSDVTLSNVSFESTGTTTFSGGISLSGGCVSVNGTCLGSGSGVTESGTTGQIPYYASDGSTLSATSSIFLSVAGNFGIGTTSPYRKLSLTDAVSTAQVAIAYDATRYTEFLTNSVGDLVVNPQGDDAFMNDDNLWVCTGGSCPSDNPTGTGNLIVENKFGIGTTTPDSKLVIETQDATTDFLRIASSTAQSLLIFDERGYLGLGTSTPTKQLSIANNFFVGNGAPTTMGSATSTIQGDLLITGKLDVSTIDPVYTVDGVKYATYGHSTIGIKEEVALKVTPKWYDEERGLYAYVLDFANASIGSDTWLFYRITDFGPYWEKLVVSLTPSFDGRAFYEEHVAGHQLLIYADKPLPVSVRLIAPRFDASLWPNTREDGGFEGLKPPAK